jgi:Carboxypeptidase regulatory-like domain
VPPHVLVYRKKSSPVFWFTTLFLFLLFANGNVSACQCGRPGPTTCQAIGPHSAVFLGVVDSIETPSYFDFLKVVSLRSSISFREQYWEFSDRVTIVFTAKEWFSGQPQKTARIHINKFLGACGYEYHPGDLFFHKGERYLVYAGDNNGILSTNHCSKTRHADDKDDAEIENLRRLHRLPSSIVTGTYVLPSIAGPSAPLVGASVALTSPVGQRFTAKTDADGGFTLSGLPPATYQIQFDTPPGYVVDWAPKTGAYWRTSEGIIPANPRELVVSPNACRDASYDALPDGRISGVATSPRGKLLEPIRIRIWPANHVDAIENSWWARYETSPTGAFRIGPLLPGTYIIATYLWPADFMERSKDVEYVSHVVPQPWFYPGTTDVAKARPITVRFAQQIAGIHFVVPSAPVRVPSKNPASSPDNVVIK